MRSGPQQVVLGNGAWQHVQLATTKLPETPAEFARVQAAGAGGGNVVWLTTPRAIRHTDMVCDDVFAWTDASLPVHYSDVGVSLNWVAPNDIPAESITASVLNVRGDTVARRHGENNEPSRSASIKLDSLDPGWYQAHVELGNCVHRWSFIVVSSELRGRSAHALGLHVEFDSLGFAKARHLGASWLRAHRVGVTTWPVVAPAPGSWSWPDSIIDAAKRAGLTILGSLDRTPEWASIAPNAEAYPWPSFYYGSAAYPPRNFSDWQEYVRSIVSRYRGRIAAWEVWNEPDIQFLAVERGTSHVETYRRLLRTAHAEIRDACPECKIVGPAVAYALEQDRLVPPDEFKHMREPTFLSTFLRSDDESLLDTFSYHAYADMERCVTTPLCSPGDAAAVVERLAVGATSGRVWRTEAGVFPEPGTDGVCAGHAEDERRVAAFMVADFVSTLAAGVERIFLFHGFFSVGPCERRALLFDGYEPRRSAAAFAALAAVLNGDTRVSRPAEDAPFRPHDVLGVFNAERDTTWVLGPSSTAYQVRMREGGQLVTQWGAVKVREYVVPAGEVAYLVGSSHLFKLNSP